MSASPSSTRVTFAAGLATEGYKPFAAIYSTFLQRAYDQVVHDVAIQRLPVRFAHRPRRPRRRRRPDPCRLVRHRLSRLPARLRADGGGRRGRARAHGRDRRWRSTTARRRCAIRAATASASTCRRSACRSRSARAASCARAPRSRCCRYGTRLQECLKAADELAAHGLSTTVADARFAKPLDTDLVLRLAREHEVLITIEEGSIGGFGALCDADAGRARRARSRPEGALHGAARRVHRPGSARPRCMRRPASTPRASSRRCSRRSARTFAST